MPIRVLVVDDHQLFRRGVIGILQLSEEFEVVGEGSNGEEAVDMVERVKPDVLIMDLSMPVMNGMEAMRQIQHMETSTRVLILTVNEEEEALFEAVKNGAQGYLIKTVEPNELLAAIRNVAAGEAVIPSNLAVKILSEIAKPKPVTVEALIEPLTQRELEVLKELGKGFSNREIAKHLFISENTVRNHVRNILDKLHMTNRVQAAAYAVREGLIKGDETS
ncbi:response regulator transcription factor [Fodinisporobacter ferrooxydans]|uniref:Response regulator transcription factor n=1 Tax=Fodinisporobacter ferrooxydans TaxID=2901836 RepID=A0ABY4CNV0_9BACL|nr:response regulator transcription factor [Alicyclobacillaceae bacterium MYW30-H2]